jgi:hypothetical protein
MGTKPFPYPQRAVDEPSLRISSFSGVALDAGRGGYADDVTGAKLMRSIAST